MSVSTLLVDARPVDHPTARQRGIGRYVTGLLSGLRDIGAPVIALHGTDAEAEVLADTIPGLRLQRWGPQVVRSHAVDGTWYLATQLMLHPIPLDPIPRCITEARLPVAAEKRRPGTALALQPIGESRTQAGLGGRDGSIRGITSLRRRHTCPPKNAWHPATCSDS